MAFEYVPELSAVFPSSYTGPKTFFTYTFTINLPDQLAAGWVAERHTNAVAAKLSENGSELLSVKIYQDKLSGTWTTDYKAEVLASGYGLAQGETPPVQGLADGEIAGSTSAWPLWAVMVVIIGVMSLLGVLIVAWALNSIKHIAEAAGPIGMVALAVVACAAVYLVVKMTQGGSREVAPYVIKTGG